MKGKLEAVVKQIDGLLTQKDLIIVAIDGKCTSGKTTLWHPFCRSIFQQYRWMPGHALSTRSASLLRGLASIVSFPF